MARRGPGRAGSPRRYPSAAHRWGHVNPALRFTDVTFTYPDTAVAALDRVLFRDPRGRFRIDHRRYGGRESTLFAR